MFIGKNTLVNSFSKRRCAKVSWNLQKKDEDHGLVNPIEQDQLENSSQNEKSPEFDEIGTALNEI